MLLHRQPIQSNPIQSIKARATALVTDLFFGLWSVDSLTSNFETRLQESTCHRRHWYAEQSTCLLGHCNQHITSTPDCLYRHCIITGTTNTTTVWSEQQ